MNWVRHVEARVEGKPGYPIVEIIWDDAMASAVSNWEEEAVAEVAVTTAVGYLVKRTRTAYMLATLINPNQFGNAITIPKGCVKEIRYLTEK